MTSPITLEPSSALALSGSTLLVFSPNGSGECRLAVAQNRFAQNCGQTHTLEFLAVVQGVIQVQRLRYMNNTRSLTGGSRIRIRPGTTSGSVVVG